MKSLTVAVAVLALLAAGPAYARELNVRGGGDSVAVGVSWERNLPYVGNVDLGVEAAEMDDNRTISGTIARRWQLPVDRTSLRLSAGVGWGDSDRDSGLAYNAGVGVDYAISEQIRVGVEQRLYRTEYDVRKHRHQDETETALTLSVAF